MLLPFGFVCVIVGFLATFRVQLCVRCVDMFVHGRVGLLLRTFLEFDAERGEFLVACAVEPVN